MPRYNVEYNNKWACYSSVPDDFITGFMSLREYEEFRDVEYGKSKIELSQSNIMRIEDAIFGCCLNRERDEIIGNMKNLGIDEDLYIPIMDKYFEEEADKK